MATIIDKLKLYFSTTSDEKIKSDWNESSKYDKIGPTVDKFLGTKENRTPLREGRVPSIFTYDDDIGEFATIVQSDDIRKVYIVLIFDDVNGSTIDIWDKVIVRGDINMLHVNCIFDIDDDFTEERLSELYYAMTSETLTYN